MSLASTAQDRRGSVDSDSGEPLDRNPAARRPRLARMGDVLPNWMKDNIKHVIRPLAYVIRETRPSDDAPVFHVVPAGKVFKSWATDQLVAHPDRRLEVEGTIQPRAPGRQLLSDAQLEADAQGARASGARRYDEPQLRTIARSGFEAIESAARHGFVFGDIKPENIMTDGNKSKFIDLDALQKVSRQGGETVLNQYSYAYLLPVAFHRAETDAAYRAGVERDLYALGMTLVESALRSARRHDLATQVLSISVGRLTDGEARQRYMLATAGQSERAWLDARAIPEHRRTIDQANTVMQGSPLMNEIRTRLGDYPVPPGSAIEFGLKCIRVALEYDSRGQSKVYDPATAAQNHPLKQLGQHPVVEQAGPAQIVGCVVDMRLSAKKARIIPWSALGAWAAGPHLAASGGSH
ncbi:MAG: Protein kinase domain [Pseudomonadota bacterium]